MKSVELSGTQPQAAWVAPSPTPNRPPEPSAIRPSIGCQSSELALAAVGVARKPVNRARA
jgi:hypothetical protein